VPFIVMELLEGIDLGARLAAEGKLSPAETLPIVSQLCKALERAHEKGVIHRDIKPANVFLATEGGDVFVKLLDFGIAKTGKVVSHGATVAGEALGTPYYMSPEQFRSAKEIDLRSDLWSVGVLVYETLTGELPFDADTVGALAIIVSEGGFVAPSGIEPSLPKAFDAWFAKACARDPNTRFGSARELAEGLRSAFGLVPETSSSARQPVTSHVDPSELRDTHSMALGDTTFAASGVVPAQVPSTRRKAVPLVVGGAVVVVASVAFWATRGHDTPVHPTAELRQSVVLPSASPIASLAPLVTASATSSTVIAASADTTVHAQPTHAKATSVASAAPSASTHAKEKSRDIW
jgi:serine/threonine protein kinase